MGCLTMRKGEAATLTCRGDKVPRFTFYSVFVLFMILGHYNTCSYPLMPRLTARAASLRGESDPTPRSFSKSRSSRLLKQALAFCLYFDEIKMKLQAKILSSSTGGGQRGRVVARGPHER